MYLSNSLSTLRRISSFSAFSRNSTSLRFCPPSAIESLRLEREILDFGSFVPEIYLLFDPVDE